MMYKINLLIEKMKLESDLTEREILLQLQQLLGLSGRSIDRIRNAKWTAPVNIKIIHQWRLAKYFKVMPGELLNQPPDELMQ